MLFIHFERIYFTLAIFACNIMMSSCTDCICSTWKHNNYRVTKSSVNTVMKYMKQYKPVITIDENRFGNKKIMEQYNKGLKDQDLYMNITDLIIRDGYPVEEHTVPTTDGYYLTMFRIPGKGSAVLLMHGLGGSADNWVSIGKDRALPYLLANAGYDVWLGNARGTFHSRGHVCLSQECREFWDFCWDDIGRYDLPAMIDYILDLTGRKNLHYIGHSQGTTAFFVMCSEKPEYNKKISIMICLAASAWMRNAKSSLVQLFGKFSPILSYVTRAFGYLELPPRNEIIRGIISVACDTPEKVRIICSNFLFILDGSDYAQLNASYLPKFLAHVPGGSSIKQVIHYGQEILSGKFRQYDYGKLKNLKKYGTVEPPDYPVEKISARVVLFHGDNDWMSQIADVETLMSKLPNYTFYRIPWPKFNHLDYLLANDVKTLVYDKIMSYLD